MGKLIIFEQLAKRKIFEGLLEAGKLVALTYGPRGKTITYDLGTDTRFTKDGISVLKSISFSDELKDIGAKLIKEASDKANEQSGDGSTSTALLTMSLCSTAWRLMNQGIDINSMRAGFRAARDFTLSELESYKRTVESEDDIYKIALVSANGDKEIADNVKEAFTSIGDGGLVSYADSMSKTGKSEVVITNGFEIDRGYITSKCVNQSGDQCHLEDASVLLFKSPIDEAATLTSILQTMPKKKNVLVISPDYGDDLKAWYTEKAPKTQIVIIRAPGNSIEQVNDNLRDLSAIINTPVIGEDVEISEFDPNTVGTATVTLTKRSSVFINPSTDKEKFDKYIKDLKKSIECNNVVTGLSHAQIDSVKSRIAKLTGGIATIYIGALTKPELSEKKDRYDDAIHAVRNSLEEGYVIGGGVPLYHISCKVYSSDDYIKNLEPAEQTAFKEFLKSLALPIKLLVKSAGLSMEVVAGGITGNNGFNAKRGACDDFIKLGIVDSYTVIRNSVIYSENVTEQFMSVGGSVISDVKNLSYSDNDDVDPHHSILDSIVGDM